MNTTLGAAPSAPTLPTATPTEMMNRQNTNPAAISPIPGATASPPNLSRRRAPQSQAPAPPWKATTFGILERLTTGARAVGREVILRCRLVRIDYVPSRRLKIEFLKDVTLRGHSTKMVDAVMGLFTAVRQPPVPVVMSVLPRGLEDWPEHKSLASTMCVPALKSATVTTSSTTTTTPVPNKNHPCSSGPRKDWVAVLKAMLRAFVFAFIVKGIVNVPAHPEAVEEELKRLGLLRVMVEEVVEDDEGEYEDNLGAENDEGEREEAVYEFEWDEDAYDFTEEDGSGEEALQDSEPMPAPAIKSGVALVTIIKEEEPSRALKSSRGDLDDALIGDDSTIDPEKIAFGAQQLRRVLEEELHKKPFATPTSVEESPKASTEGDASIDPGEIQRGLEQLRRVWQEEVRKKANQR
ncbi:hypothetical protein DXG03_006407 [Asterophora parasitica]|uniref:Uncharacterized protein n=1 Tax=Asterophora parasitica TaxID=117018 RepID=A0A9P7KDY5_9AGAR|nr:hypothetical protein DXG03_006407 [Asterophora parasitica]